MMEAAARLVARIDLDRLAANWRSLKALSGEAETAAVIKANAYGHGVRAAALALDHVGCRWFFTASMDEAVTVRSILPEALIGVFDGLTRHDRDAVLGARILPSINSPEDLAILAEWARERGAPIPAMMQLDTGMNRLGAGAAEAAAMVEADAFAAGDWKLVYSHLASADEPEKPQSVDQKTRFDAILARLPGLPASLSATGGIMLGDGFHYQLTRPGIGLYGLPPVPELGQHLKPVLSLHARILQIRTAAKGETVGYNATATLTRLSRLATIAGGYADGVRRPLSNLGQAHCRGLDAPIIGRVSMDTSILDITDWPEDHVAPGDRVDLLHDGYTADDMARASGTIGYDILTALGLRAEAHYAGGILSSIDL